MGEEVLSASICCGLYSWTLQVHEKGQASSNGPYFTLRPAALIFRSRSLWGEDETSGEAYYRLASLVSRGVECVKTTRADAYHQWVRISFIFAEIFSEFAPHVKGGNIFVSSTFAISLKARSILAEAAQLAGLHCAAVVPPQYPACSALGTDVYELTFPFDVCRISVSRNLFSWQSQVTWAWPITYGTIYEYDGEEKRLTTPKADDGAEIPTTSSIDPPFTASQRYERKASMERSAWSRRGSDCGLTNNQLPALSSTAVDVQGGQIFGRPVTAPLAPVQCRLIFAEVEARSATDGHIFNIGTDEIAGNLLAWSASRSKGSIATAHQPRQFAESPKRAFRIIEETATDTPPKLISPGLRIPAGSYQLISEPPPQAWTCIERPKYCLPETCPMYVDEEFVVGVAPDPPLLAPAALIPTEDGNVRLIYGPLKGSRKIECLKFRSALAQEWTLGILLLAKRFVSRQKNQESQGDPPPAE